VPTTIPGDQAWLDLQCADSGGPSNLLVNQKTGQIYAVFGTRSSAAGGCGASVTGSFEINVVAATRVWVATATPDSATQPGGWSQSLAVDDNATGQIVGMQLAPGALDNAGNIYVFYPESPKAYPDYDGAALKYVHAPADMSSWSAPVTVAPAGGAGHLLPHIVAGDPGKLGFAYFTGVEQRNGDKPLWYMTAAQTLDGLSASPHIIEHRLSPIATYQWTASEMMGACGSGPAAGVENGFNCNRSTDVWGIALDAHCRAVFTWPVQSDGSEGATKQAKSTQGTYVAEQTGGPTLCKPSARVAAEESTPSPTAQPQPNAGQGSTGPSLPNTASTVAPGVGIGGLAVLLVVGTAARRRRRHSHRG
jgi:LPXTG-motif cell wall-anchored protein